jgi:hypothetical protein
MRLALWCWGAVALNWGGFYLVSWGYAAWLWRVSRDIRLEGWGWWGPLPVARFRLISRKSWYGRLWRRFYGAALLGVMIVRDERGAHDDVFVDSTLVHEMRHVQQAAVLGALQPLLYCAHMLWLWGRRQDPYRDNWFERDARAAELRWELAGRPRLPWFGERR